MNDRIQALLALLEKRPDDARIRFGLAAAYESAGRWEEAATQLKEYLRLTEDEGNAWGRLAHASLRLGLRDAARDAWAKGIEAARRHGHPSMAAEFEEALRELAHDR